MILDKHGLIYGYFLIKRENLIQQKYEFLSK